MGVSEEESEAGLGRRDCEFEALTGDENDLVKSAKALIWFVTTSEGPLNPVGCLG